MSLSLGKDIIVYGSFDDLKRVEYICASLATSPCMPIEKELNIILPNYERATYCKYVYEVRDSAISKFPEDVFWEVRDSYD